MYEICPIPSGALRERQAQALRQAQGERRKVPSIAVPGHNPNPFGLSLWKPTVPPTVHMPYPLRGAARATSSGPIPSGALRERQAQADRY
jgi:hypothetical protein